MRWLAAALILCVSPAHAGDTYTWGSPFYASTIRLQPTQAPGAVAEVEFVNKTVHTDQDVTFTLDMDGLSVEVFAQVGRGLTPDRMTITPPDGYLAIPEVLDVPEDETGVILIVPFLGY
jgi:hypothetical protein